MTPRVRPFFFPRASTLFVQVSRKRRFGGTVAADWKGLSLQRCCEVVGEVVSVGGSEARGEVPACRCCIPWYSCSIVAVVLMSCYSSSRAERLRYNIVEVFSAQLVGEWVKVSVSSFAHAVGILVGKGEPLGVLWGSGAASTYAMSADTTTRVAGE